jgi:uncharacterized SAM-binding protein YcdF (DUF218 family)
MRTALSRPRRMLGLTARALLLIALILLAVAAIRWQATLNWLGNYLVCSDPLEPADLILVMGGDFWGPRVSTAAQLGALGFAPLVLISGPHYSGRPEGELAIEFLVKQGYPKDKFASFAHSEPSTVGEVRVLASELARRGVKRVIVVTSSYHSRRCALLFRLFCPGIHFISAPAPDSHYRPDEWWKDSNSHALFISEWTKILGSVLIAYPAYRLSHWSW